MQMIDGQVGITADDVRSEEARCYRMLQQACRGRLGAAQGSADAEDRRELLSIVIGTLPPTIDRPAVFRAVADALARYGTHAIASPEWCEARDSALLSIGESIERLRRVLLRTGLESADSALGPFLEAYAALSEHPFLVSTPEHRPVPTAAGGRPASTWVRHAKEDLKALGLSRRQVDEILSAVHLTADLAR